MTKVAARHGVSSRFLARLCNGSMSRGRRQAVSACRWHRL